MAGLRRCGRDGSAARDALAGRQRRPLLDAAHEQVEGVLRMWKNVLERGGKEVLVALDVVAVLYLVETIRRSGPVGSTRLSGQACRHRPCIGAGVMVDGQQ